MKNKGKSVAMRSLNGFVIDKKYLEKVITWEFDSE